MRSLKDLNAPSIGIERTYAMREDVYCRGCGAERLDIVLDLGRTPLANELVNAATAASEQKTYELELAFCRSCALVQLTEVVPPEVLFSEYPYFSSFSDTMVDHARALVERLVASRGLGPESLVLEVASNDGYLLQHYVEKGIPVLGIEPAANVAAVAIERGVDTLVAFFGEEVSRRLASDGLVADVVHANNVFAHVPDVNGFLSGIRAVTKPAGVAVIEVPYIRDMVDRCEFDTIYHEHLYYYSATSVDRLVRRHGLTLVDVERLPIHGGSLRLTVAHAGAPPSPRVAALLSEEDRLGMAAATYYESFGRHVQELQATLRNLLSGLKRQNKRIAAYGASAKGSTLLNTSGIGAETIDFVVDRSTVKQGRFTPGTGLEIRSPEALEREQPDYVLLLTWNFADEILAQQEAYRASGGRFIVPVPTPVIV
jgi:SAM-dependent methyltransferase